MNTTLLGSGLMESGLSATQYAEKIPAGRLFELIDPPQKAGVYEVTVKLEKEVPVKDLQKLMRTQKIPSHLGPWAIGSFFDRGEKGIFQVTNSDLQKRIEHCATKYKSFSSCPEVKSLKYRPAQAILTGKSGKVDKIKYHSILKEDLPLPEGVVGPIKSAFFDKDGRLVKVKDSRGKLIDMPHGVGFAVTATVAAIGAFLSAIAALGFAILKLGLFAAIAYVVFKAIVHGVNLLTALVGEKNVSSVAPIVGGALLLGAIWLTFRDKRRVVRDV